MLFTAADLAAVLVQDLPPEVPRIVEAHFFDGESNFKIQRRYQLKRWELEAMIEADTVDGAWLCTIVAKGRCRTLFMDAAGISYEHQDDSNIHG
jgi:hypothetical protein